MPAKFALAALLALCAVSRPPARATELSGLCCSDLEERIAELEALTASKGNRKVSLTISGLITWPIMAWDDGHSSDAFVVSNEVKRPRLRVSGEGRIDPKWSASYVLEIGPNPSPLAAMDQLRFESSAEHLELRFSYWGLKNADFGQLTMGLQSQATDTISEVTLANTASVVSPGLPILLGYVERGWFMRKADGVLSTLRFGDILFRGRNDSWGENHRWHVVRYDSPLIGGFSFATSWGEDDAKDAAIRYSGEVGRLKLAAAAGVMHWTDGGNQSGCAVVHGGTSDLDCLQFAGSASIMDKETGLFANFAAGRVDDRKTRELYGGAPVDHTEDFYYAVAGIEQQWFPIGKTTLFGQYWHKDIGAGVFFNGSKLDASGLGALPFVSSANVSIYGASLVQTLAEGVDLYFSFNRTETEVRTSPTGTAKGSVATKVEPFDFLIAGMAVRF